jgi:ferrous iron transport protein A
MEIIALTALARGQRALIVAVEAEPSFGQLDGQVGLRLRELGFLPGVEVQVLGFGFLGSDPIAVRLGDSKFALRAKEAGKLRVKPL